MAASNRSTGASGNARRQRGASAAKGGARKQSKARSTSTFQPIDLRGSAAGDIVGVVIAVIAIAMTIALAAPSTAPVTHAMERFLTLCFGAGAFLLPVALFVFALTFFIDDDDPVTGRVAIGLSLIIVSLLALVSLNAQGAATTPNSVIAPEAVGGLGGYVGGGVAWVLLSLVGRWVGNVVMVGTIIAGAVVCGFSISGAVTKMRGKAREASESYRDAAEVRKELRAQRASERRAARAARRVLAVADDIVYDDDEPYEEPATTYLGSRTTTVLTRRRTQPQESVEDVETRLLGRRNRAAEPAPAPVETPVAQQPQRTLFDDPSSYVAAEAAPAKRRAKTSAEESPADNATGFVPDFLQRGHSSRAAAHGEGGGAVGATTAASLRGTKAVPQPETASPQPQPEAPQKTRRSKPKAAPKPSKRPGEGDEAYELPPFNMLSSNPNSASSASSREELDDTMARLQATLAEFGLTSRVVDYTSGPLVTTFQVEMGEGERVNKITNLQDDIALSLAAKSVRIFAPIPGTSRVGIEIPNKARQNVHLGDVLPYATGGPLSFAIGRDAEGRAVTADLASMPHLLVAGATGSGKSVMINSLIMSLLMRTTPKQVRLILVDPKRVEFSGYNGLPHLYVPVVTEPRQAASALQWAVSEMERRLKVFERAGARNINVYNEMCVKGKLSEAENPPEPMPFMVIIIDELADLMMVAGKDVEASIVRIAQLARAAGIHLVLATQRPSANVVTGLIKSNIETRIALSVASGTDSRVILDQVGAQRLLGNGDMLFKERGGLPRRVLGCFVSDPEIEAVVDFIRDQAEPDYHEEILSAVVPGQPGGGGASDLDEEDDPLVWEAAQIVVESQLGSTSGLQRRLKVGYARAGRIMDMLEAKGVVGPPDGSKPREVLIDMEGLEELRTLDAQYREV